MIEAHTNHDLSKFTLVEPVRRYVRQRPPKVVEEEKDMRTEKAVTRRDMKRSAMEELIESPIKNPVKKVPVIKKTI